MLLLDSVLGVCSMTPEAETEQSEMPDKTYTEPSDGFEAKKLMKEYDDGRWMEDPAKIRGSILQWAKSDSLILKDGDEPTIKELYLAWDGWLASKLSYSWLLLKTRGDDKERMFRYFVDYLESNDKIRQMAEERAKSFDRNRSVEGLLHEHFKSSADIDLVSTSDEDEHDEAVYHVERTSKDSKLKHQVNLEPTDVPRVGIDNDPKDVLGYSISGYYTVEGIPCFILDNGEETYEVPLHYLAEDND